MTTIPFDAILVVHPIESDPTFVGASPIQNGSCGSDPILDGAGVYLLHFDPPYRHAGHYLGWSDDMERRTAHHLAGRGHNPLVDAALAAGSVVTVARTWPGADRSFESRLKRHGKTRVCPLCPGPTRDPK